jgi:RNA polymerase sigma-70 factor (ECF subfamily)
VEYALAYFKIPGTIAMVFPTSCKDGETMEACVSNPERLLVLALAGDQVSLGRLLEMYREYLSLLARLHIGRRLQGKVDAADLVQDTFLEAHRNWKRFRGASEKELLSWLRSILTARTVDLLRRYLGSKGRDVRLERELALELERSSRDLDCGLLAKQDSPSKQVARREQGVLLADALALLPEDYREVLILRHLEGLTFPGVSQRMGRTLDSVKKLWTRALDCLRRSLKGMS